MIDAALKTALDHQNNFSPHHQLSAKQEMLQNKVRLIENKNVIDSSKKFSLEALKQFKKIKQDDKPSFDAQKRSTQQRGSSSQPCHLAF